MAIGTALKILERENYIARSHERNGQAFLKFKRDIGHVSNGLPGKAKVQQQTLAGFIIDQFGGIPAQGEILHYGQLTFLVKEATPRSVDEIIVEIEEKT